MGTIHAGMIGKPQTGKSTLGKIFCADGTRKKRETLVFDITLLDDEVDAMNKGAVFGVDTRDNWEACAVTNDEDTFNEVFWAASDLLVFIDEGNETAGRGSSMRFTVTRGSHQLGELGAGSSIFVISHGYSTLDKTMRTQLSEWFIFNVARESARDLADEFDDDTLLGATKLAKGEFYHVGTGIPVTKHRINFETLEIEDIP